VLFGGQRRFSSKTALYNGSMQTHYGFVQSLNLKEITTPLNYRKQFVIYSYQDQYPRKRAVDAFLRSHGTIVPLPHYVLISRTMRPYTMGSSFVFASQANFQRFLRLLRVIKPNNAFLKVEAFHTGDAFSFSQLYDPNETPFFLSGTNEVEIGRADINLVWQSMNRISRLKFEQAHRINNFYDYLEYCIKGTINHRIIWMFIAFESLFHIQGGRGYTKEFCKRVSFFLEPSDKVPRKRIYDFLLEAADKRGKLVHGALVNDQDIKNTLAKLEPLVWRIGNSLMTADKKWLKLFSSLEPQLERYFRFAERQPLS
jgi:hypothetical protein